MGRARELANLFSGGSADINVKTSDGGILNLQTSDTTVVANDVIGSINFQAPDEGSGTDAILLASKIEAVAEGTFSTSSNATSLVFSTASSAAAGTVAGKMTFTSGGELVIKDTDTADGSSPTITLQSGDTDIAQDDVLGTINFQAPDEGTGTDAILVAAGIAAVSEGDFAVDNNATKLSFKTGASEAAAEKMSLSSAGLLTVSGRIITDDTTEATSTTDGSLQTDGGLSVAKDAVIGDDLKLLSDASVIHFGTNSEVTLTHVHDTGLSLNDNLTITTADNDPQLTLISTDADSSVGPRINLYRNSSSPADDDALGFIYAQGENDADELTDYGFIGFFADDVTDGSEDGNAYLILKKDGTSRNRINLTSTETVFNDDSVDVNFRVESDGNAGMLFVDAGLNIVGVGTNTPNVGAGTHQANSRVIMQVTQGDSGVIAGDNFHGYTALVVEGEAGLDGVGINIVADNSAITQIAFGDPEDSNVGVIYYSHSSNQMSFLTNAGERLRIASDGTLTGSDTDGIGSLSDERLKENIKDYTHDLTSFKKLKPKTFDWKNPSEHGDKSGVRGFIAQELLDADSYTVYQEPVALVEYDNIDCYKEGDGSDYDLISPNDKGERLSYASKLGGNDAMYVSVIQQLITKIETLETKVKTLEDA